MSSVFNRIRSAVVLLPDTTHSVSILDLGLSVRANNRLRALGVRSVGDLGQYSDEELLAIDGFGRRTLFEVEAAINSLASAGSLGEASSPSLTSSSPCMEGAQITHVAVANSELRQFMAVDCQKGLICALNAWLEIVPPRTARIVSSRLGLEGGDQTLEALGSEFGVTRERIRQVQKKFITRVWSSDFRVILHARLGRLLQGRITPLYIAGLQAEDPWFAAVPNPESVIGSLVEALLPGQIHVLVLHERAVVARITEEEWLSRIKSAKQWVESSVSSRPSLRDVRVAIEAIASVDAPELAQELWNVATEMAHFSLRQDANVAQLVAFGRSVEAMVRSILEDSDHPLHYTEIAAQIERRYGERDVRRVHSAAIEVGFLLGRGIYGVRRHVGVPLDKEGWIVEACEDFVRSGPVERQWHALELIEFLETEFDEVPKLDAYALSAILQTSQALQYLGRFVWQRRGGVGNRLSSRIDCAEAAIALLEDAGGPLTTAEIFEKIRGFRGLGGHSQIHPRGRLMRLQPGTWGLVDRDVSMPPDVSSAALDYLVDVLGRRQRALHVSELSRVLCGLGVPEECNWQIRGLAQLDARFAVAPGELLCLSGWTTTNRLSLPEVLGLIAVDHPEGFILEDIIELASELLERPASVDSIRGALRAMGAEYDVIRRVWNLPGVE